MKKLVAVMLLLFASNVFAADPKVVTDSAQPLIGALESLPMMDNVIVVASYLPGYGLQLNSVAYQISYQGETTAALDIAQSVQDIAEGLAVTIQGLEPGDRVSVGLTYQSAASVDIVVRIKPGQPESSELWINGEKIE